VNAYGNTLASPLDALGIVGGASNLVTATFTNNILIGILTLALNAGRYSIVSDCNLMSHVDNLPVGPHGMVTNYAGFVNTNSGLYWLNASSPARGAAFITSCGPVDFFGRAQSTVTDVGAFQYNSVYASDSRVLDPSPALPDYWSLPARPPPPAGLRALDPNQH